MKQILKKKKKANWAGMTLVHEIHSKVNLPSFNKYMAFLFCSFGNCLLSFISVFTG